MAYPRKLTREQIDEFFPSHRKPLKEGIFEIGLALGGTASAGAYTAGVLDYLLEALDAWQYAKDHDHADAPKHEVVISTMAGSSGGGINGAILLRAAGWRFPSGPDPDNPFYSFWMGEASDLWELLRPGPAAGIPGFTSLLNCTAIDVQASRTVEYRGQALGTADSPTVRGFLSDPLRLFLTLGNLNGLPYKIQLEGASKLSHVLCAHGDYMRFALRTGSPVGNRPTTRPDEIELRSEWPPDANWMHLRDAAVATSAFPLLLLPRPLSRLMEVCGYRVAVVPGDYRQDEIVQLVPDWPTLVDGEQNPAESTFLSVDGGVFNNEPLDLVRTALAGFNDRNRRDPDEADRAVIMIDPFSDPEPLQRPEQADLGQVFADTLGSLVYQARFKPEDIALACADDVYSRYLIAPVGFGPYGKRTVGQRAIASGALGGHSGFIDRSFRKYDFQLGRYNAYWFLARHLALPVDPSRGLAEIRKRANRIFSCWKDEHFERYMFEEDGKHYLPIIPLMERLRNNAPKAPEWPRLPEVPDYLESTIRIRLQSLYDLATSQLLRPRPWWQRILLRLYLDVGWRTGLKGSLSDAGMAAIKSALMDQGLVAQPPPVRTRYEAGAAFR